MVRYLVAFGISVVAGLLLEGSAPGAPQDQNDDAPAAASGTIAGEGATEARQPRRTETAGMGLVSCQVCAGPTCASVQVRGRCTVDRVVDALRAQSATQTPLSDATRHRARAVSEADFAPMAPGDMAGVNRAAAAPQQAAGKGAGPGAQLLDIYENPDELLSTHESGPLSIEAQFFRPLDLGKDAADEDQAADDKDEGNP